jgi:bifunctional non-homologous end joining protein LigD
MPAMFAFDMLEVNGEDYRSLMLLDRKARLRKLLARSKDGIYFNDHLEHDGRVVFEHACKLGCEGIVVKRAESRTRRAGTHWLHEQGR